MQRSARTAQGQAGQDARRRLAGEQERLADRAERLQDNVKRMAQSGQGDAGRAQSDGRCRTRARTPEARRAHAAVGEALAPGQRRRRRDAQRRGRRGSVAQDARGKARTSPARSIRSRERLGAASGAQDADSRRLSDQLSKAQELREQVASLNRDIERAAARERSAGSQQGQHGQQGTARVSKGQPGPGQPGAGAAGQAGGRRCRAARVRSRRSAGGRAGRRQRARRIDAANKAARGGSDGGVQQLQRDVNERMRDADRLADEMRRENPGMQGAKTPEELVAQLLRAGHRGVQAGLRALGIAEAESAGGPRTRRVGGVGPAPARENKERLNAGGHETVSEPYRALVEKYYRSLAAPRKPQ